MNVVTKTLATTLLTGTAMTANAAYIPTFTSGQTTTVDDCRRDTEGLPCGPGNDGCCTPSGSCSTDCF